jgi:hypothetical protein
MKDGQPLMDSIQKEFVGYHDYKTIIKPFRNAQIIQGLVNHSTVNEIVDVLRPSIITMSDLDAFAEAIIIDPVSRLDSGDMIRVAPYYRDKNIVCLRFEFTCDRPGDGHTWPGDQRLVEFSYVEYDTDTSKIVKENVPIDEASEKRALFVERILGR